MPAPVSWQQQGWSYPQTRCTESNQWGSQGKGAGGGWRDMRVSGASPLLVLSPSSLLGTAGMAQTPPGRGSLRVSAISPPPSCTLPLRDFLIPFIRLLGVIIPRALLGAKKQGAEEMEPHSLSRAGRRQAGRWGPRRQEEDGGEQGGSHQPPPAFLGHSPDPRDGKRRAQSRAAPHSPHPYPAAYVLPPREHP